MIEISVQKKSKVNDSDIPIQRLSGMKQDKAAKKYLEYYTEMVEHFHKFGNDYEELLRLELDLNKREQVNSLLLNCWRKNTSVEDFYREFNLIFSKKQSKR